MEAAKMELEERERVQEELQGVRVWLEAAEGLLMEVEESNNMQELQVLKLVFIRITSVRLLWSLSVLVPKRDKSAVKR